MKSPGEDLIIRMWETVEKVGCGFLAPWQARRMGRANALAQRDTTLLLAQTERDVAALKDGTARLDHSGAAPRICHTTETRGNGAQPTGRVEPSFASTGMVDRALGAAAAEALSAEVNRTKALFHAESWLANQFTPAPEASVDSDWLEAWRVNAGRTSAEQMQRLWGRVLAGEVAAPNTYSLRTLDFLRTLSKSEADDIARLAPLVVEDTVPSDFPSLHNERGVGSSLLIRLQAIGLLSGVGGISIGRRYTPGVLREVAFRTVGHHIVVRWNNESLTTPQVDLNGFRLTPLGVELMRLCEVEPDVEFAEAFAQSLADKHLDVTLCSLELGPDGKERRINCRVLKNRLSELLRQHSSASQQD
jgi:hypothetical protein